jgi:hypothetical protein
MLGERTALSLRFLTPESDFEAKQAVLEEISAGGRRFVLLIHCSVRAWKGRPGLAPDLAFFLRTAVEALGEAASVVALAGSSVIEPLELPDVVTLAFGTGPACEGSAVRALFD